MDHRYLHLNRTHPDPQLMTRGPPGAPMYKDGPPPSPTYKEYYAQMERKRHAVECLTSPTAKLPRRNHQLYNHQRIASGSMVEKRSPVFVSSAFRHPERITAEEMILVQKRYSELHPGKYIELASPKHLRKRSIDGQYSLQLSPETAALQQRDHGNERLIPSHVHQQVKRTKSSSKCVFCNGEAQFLCSGCHMAWYCTRKCQVSNTLKFLVV